MTHKLLVWLGVANFTLGVVGLAACFYLTGALAMVATPAFLGLVYWTNNRICAVLDNPTEAR